MDHIKLFVPVHVAEFETFIISKLHQEYAGLPLFEYSKLLLT